MSSAMSVGRGRDTATATARTRSDRLVITVRRGVHSTVTLVQLANPTAKAFQSLSRPVSMHVPQSDDADARRASILCRHRTHLKPCGEIVEPCRLMMRQSQLQAAVAFEQRLMRAVRQVIDAV
jgi:hypothetical protein